jgi:uncharacterized protein YbgA (DUF1722 family)
MLKIRRYVIIVCISANLLFPVYALAQVPESKPTSVTKESILEFLDKLKALFSLYPADTLRNNEISSAMCSEFQSLQAQYYNEFNYLINADTKRPNSQKGLVTIHNYCIRLLIRRLEIQIIK